MLFPQDVVSISYVIADRNVHSDHHQNGKKEAMKMKARLLIIFRIAIFVGILQIPESFSEDYFSIPSCHTGVFINDHVVFN